MTRDFWLLTRLKLNLSIFFFFITTTLSSELIDPYYLACKNPSTTTCGDGQIVKYPFHIESKQDSSCGYPGFELTCNGGGHPVLNFDDYNYVIKKFDYENETILVSNDAVSNSSCSLSKIQNISLPASHFVFTKSDQMMILLSDCNYSSHAKSKYIVNNNCQQNDTVWAMLEGNWNSTSEFGDCARTVAVPVSLYFNESENDDAIDVENVLKRGFELKWIAEGCTECEDSGGKCGFNSTMYQFRCFCSDRPHALKCSTAPPSPATLPAPEATGNRTKLLTRLGIAVGTSTIGILLIFVAYCLIRRKNHMTLFPWKKTQADRKVEAFLRQHGSLSPKRYMYSEIKKMTGSFRDKLGQGGFGAVYKGKLPNGRLVAVKLLNRSKGNGEDFINEVASISRTSHVNVVTLLGFCLQGRKRALVYEFMPNGSLEKFIYSDKKLEASRELGWEKLYQITIGIARGLEYLHRGCNTMILHFDIKPHNILLGDEFSPKISDFGLAKLCSARESKISMQEARGTIGYIAPEVFSRNFGPVSHKSDVYSYGMMVLEMVGGRKNLDVGVSNISEIYFPHWIYKRLELGTEFQGLQGVTTGEETEVVRKMILVGLWCIQANPSDRPAISKVIEMLEGNIEALEVPPRPFLNSPPMSPPPQSMSDSTTTLLSVCTSKV